MHCYETLYIIHPEAGEGGETAKAEVEKRIADTGGRIYHRENWGSKRLAYDIAKQTKGNYQLLQYVGTAETLSEMERLFRLDEAYLKFLTTRLKDDPATAGTDTGADETEAKDSPAKDENADTKAESEDKAEGKSDDAKADDTKAEAKSEESTGEPAAAATGE